MLADLSPPQINVIIYGWLIKAVKKKHCGSQHTPGDTHKKKFFYAKDNKTQRGLKDGTMCFY